MQAGACDEVVICELAVDILSSPMTTAITFCIRDGYIGYQKTLPVAFHYISDVIKTISARPRPKTTTLL